MAEGFFIFFIAVAIIAITAIIFGGWAVVTLLRMIFRAFGALFGDLPANKLEHSATPTKICHNQGCGASNPQAAAFCRRCGRQFSTAQRVQSRRVAMW